MRIYKIQIMYNQPTPIGYFKVIKSLAAGWWFSPCTLVSSTNKSDRHDITETLLKVALNTITQPYLEWVNICGEFFTGIAFHVFFTYLENNKNYRKY